MADAYASRAQLYQYGLPRGLLASPGRLISAASASTDTFPLDQHGFEDGDVLLFRAEEGGSLPGGITAGAPYYAIRSTESTFQVAAEDGGAPVALSTDGASIVVSASLETMLDAQLVRYSRLFDSYVVGHEVPLEAPYPEDVSALVAQLAATSALAIMGQASATLNAEAEQARRELARLAKGYPIRNALMTPQTNLASTATIANGRGWDTVDNTIP